MDDETYETAVRYLKDVVNGLQNSKLHDIASVRTLYIALCRIQSTLSTACEAEITATANLAVLEETFSLRGVAFNKSIQTLLASVYQVVLDDTPGYIARNVINSLLAVCQNRSHQIGARECAANVIGWTVERRSKDLGSILTDVVTCMTKFSKASEPSLRIVGVQVLLRSVRYAGSGVSDSIAEMSKLAAKLTTDKCADVRCPAIELLAEIAKSSNGFTLATADSLLAPLIRSLEDEVVSAQDTAAKSIAIVYFEQIRLHETEQEQAKIGQARGGSAENETSDARPASVKRGSLLKFKDLSMRDIIVTPKKSSDEFDLQSVFRTLLRTITKATGAMRAGYVATLRYLLVLVLPEADKSTFEWIMRHILLSLQDATILSLPYEEVVNYRNRLSHTLHRGVLCNLSETEQLAMVSFYINTINEPDPKNEHVVQLILNQLCILITILQEAVVSLSQEIHNMILQQLKNSSFGVRSCAAFVLTSLAVVTPAAAAIYLQDALTGAQSHVHLLRQFDEEDVPDDQSEGAASTGPTNEGQTPRKTPRDTERLQRMFCFHGHTLVISIILKNERALSTGLPLALIMKTFDFGMEMLTFDVQSAPANMRHVICSIIRAGSLIVASCLHMGYDIVKTRVPKMMTLCSNLVSASDEESSKGQEVLYELMSVEAALVCISALLWYCPDSLVYDENCLVTIVEILEVAFRAIKSKYQPKFRGHFRFRTLHVILLECFAWLPPGSFPNTCQSLFIEGLRVFRDSISSGFECSNMSQYLPKDYDILHVAGYMKNSDFPLTEDLMMLRVENYSVALQKKESEAFLATFSKSNQEFNRTPLHASEWNEPFPPCAFIDSRTIDASVALIGATFGHQTNEYQEKAIQLCSQAILQFFKPNTSLFTSEEERKKKERKSYVCIKNVIVMLSSIIKSFPYHNGMSLEMDLHWVQIVMEKMYELLVSSNTEIRSVVSSTLGTFCGKIFGAHVLETISYKIINHIKANLEKKGETMVDCVGHVLALSAIWENSRNTTSVQQSILNIVFDCLKKSDTAIVFKSNCLFTLARILKSRSSIIGGYDRSDTNALISRIIHTLEVHVLSFSDSVVISDIELLLICLQRLVNVALMLILEIDPESKYLTNLTTIWQIIQKCSNHAVVQRESLEFVVIGASMLFNIINPLDVVKSIKSLLHRFERGYRCYLPTIVDCIRVLVMKHSDVACAEGLDIEMFKLLDWCVASAPVLCTTPYWGLELNDGMTKVIGDVTSLQRNVEATLNAFVSIEVQIDPDHRVVSWLLLCRAIILGLQPSKSGEGDDDTGGVSLQQYLVTCRDRAAEKAEEIIARTRVKCMALQCATVALSAVAKLPMHTTMSLARQAAQSNFSSCSVTELPKLPCYAALFLHDFINLACASAVFSIDDHPMICLQEASLDFLQIIINIFWDAVDADNSENKLLAQYIAQIVSAIRPCLAAKYSPSLQWTAANLASSLIRGGLVSDKTVVRRLVKLILTPVEAESFTSRCELSVEVAGELSLLSHIIAAANAAVLFNISGLCPLYMDVDESVKSVIASLFSPSLDRLSGVWDSIVVDSMRILQNYRKWPKGTLQSDCRRGGICYDASVDVSKLQIYLESMLPFILAADLSTLVASSSCETDIDVTSRFAILDYVWENIVICSESKYFTSNAMHHPPSVLEPLIIYSYGCCARIKSSSVVAVTSWQNFLTHLATQHLQSGKSIDTYCSALQLCSKLIDNIDMSRENDSMGWLAWRICIATARCAMSPLFAGECDDMYPAFVDITEFRDSSLMTESKKIIPHFFDCLSAFVKMRTADMRSAYAMSLLVATAPLICTCFPESDIVTKVTSTMSQLPDIIVNSKKISCPELIIQEMWRYHNLYLDADAPRLVPEENSGKFLTKLWVATNFSSKEPPAVPLHLEAILLSRHASNEFVHSILSELLSALQDANIAIAQRVQLALCLLPTMLEQLCCCAVEVQMILVKLILVQFNILESNPARVSFLSMVLPALCRVIANTTQGNITTAIGKAVTHVAKSFPMQFKEAIVQGTDKEREVLQAVMRSVMQQATGSSDDRGSDKAKGMKIDMSKYNKADK